ncbi:MAG: hypothetical protein ACRD96_25805 [Bryobacteraceae bacterium]
MLLLAASAEADRLTRAVAASGRVLEIGLDRLATVRDIAPGAPPLLSFRFFEGKSRHRFGEFDLVMDDAGH